MRRVRQIKLAMAQENETCLKHIKKMIAGFDDLTRKTYSRFAQGIDTMIQPRRILFVCHANAFRSVLAERCCTRLLVHVGRDKDFEVISRGLQGARRVPPPRHLRPQDYAQWPHAAPALEEAGISFDGHIATPLRDEDVQHASAIVAMDSLVLRYYPYSLVHYFPDDRPRMHLFGDLDGTVRDIFDPQGVVDTAIYRAMIADVSGTLKRHLDTLLSWAEYTPAFEPL